MRKTKGMRNSKSNQKGITLIALVITIIVLLILAGVAISMLSGENGILKQAGEAKTETEQAQKVEETRLTDYEVIMDFKTNNTPYKFSDGYLTGVNMVKTGTILCAGTVETVKLPNGYEIFSYNEETEKYELAGTDEKMRTGMLIKKDGKEIGKVIVYGDITEHSDGKITGNDTAFLQMLISNNDINDLDKIAGDVNHDGILNWEDARRIKKYAKTFNVDKQKELINQNVAAQSANSIKIETYEESMKNWVNSLDNTVKAKFEWQDAEGGFSAYIYTTESVTVETVLEDMPGAAIVGGTSNTILGTDEIISDGDKIMLYPDFETTSSSDMLEIGQIKLQ